MIPKSGRIEDADYSASLGMLAEAVIVKPANYDRVKLGLQHSLKEAPKTSLLELRKYLDRLHELFVPIERDSLEGRLQAALELATRLERRGHPSDRRAAGAFNWAIQNQLFHKKWNGTLTPEEGKILAKSTDFANVLVEPRKLRRNKMIVGERIRT
ncbi:MAG: hypothetical protein HYZ53_23145 [Planctomycetes bacterium]|nr:hypothetical protein [Planctomycetota bacterium]